MNTTSLSQLASDLVSAAANGIYQGLALAALLWIVFKLQRRANASTRYAAAFLTLLAIAALPFAHLVLPGTDLSTSNTKPAAQTPSTNPVTFGYRNTARLPVVETIPSASPTPQSIRKAFPSKLSEKASAPSVSIYPDSSSSPTMSRIHWRANLPSALSIGLVCAWLGISAILLSRLGHQYIQLQRLKRRSDLPEPALAATFASLLQETLPGRSVSLLVSDRLSTPLAAGLGNPTIFLPKFLCDSTEAAELEGILLHELAHLRRRDDWTNLTQQIVYCALFFHPAVWWISRRMAVDREIACDDHVLAQTRRPKTYALLLTHFAGQRQTQPWAAAPAAWINTNQLKERIVMILDKSRNASPRLARGRLGSIVAGAFALAIFATLFGPRVALATSSSEGDALPPVGSERKFKEDDRARSADQTTELPLAPAPAATPAPRPHPAPHPSPKAATEEDTVSISNDSTMELEQRVAELQRLVETLVEEQLQTDFDFQPKLENLEKQLEHLENFEWDLPHPVPHNFDFHFDSEAHKQAMKEAERAMEEGVKAYEKAIENAQALAEAQVKNQLNSQERQGAMREAHRAALERQRAQLERQLAQLEQQRERLNQQIQGLESQLDHLEAE